MSKVIIPTTLQVPAIPGDLAPDEGRRPAPPTEPGPGGAPRRPSPALGLIALPCALAVGCGDDGGGPGNVQTIESCRLEPSAASVLLGTDPLPPPMTHIAHIGAEAGTSFDEDVSGATEWSTDDPSVAEDDAAAGACPSAAFFPAEIGPASPTDGAA